MSASQKFQVLCLSLRGTSQNSGQTPGGQQAATVLKFNLPANA